MTPHPLIGKISVPGTSYQKVMQPRNPYTHTKSELDDILKAFLIKKQNKRKNKLRNVNNNIIVSILVNQLFGLVTISICRHSFFLMWFLYVIKTRLLRK